MVSNIKFCLCHHECAYFRCFATSSVCFAIDSCHRRYNTRVRDYFVWWCLGHNIYRVQRVLSISQQSRWLCTGNENLHICQSAYLGRYNMSVSLWPRLIKAGLASLILCRYVCCLLASHVVDLMAGEPQSVAVFASWLSHASRCWLFIWDRQTPV